ncbi:MAG: D-alanyl-D-alanine carboxypeptidase family protein [Bacillota bacterium]
MLRRLLVFVALLAIAALPAGASLGPAALEAKAYLVMDATTGRVLISHEGDTPLPMASTTKIMTAILAIERGRLTDLVTVGQKPYDTGGATIFLEIGEQQTLENLIYALMLESANDAGVAIAEHLAGSEERFADWMNEKARTLGATRTHFVNSHGLHEPGHVSTAFDLALIARYAMRNPTFRQIVAAEEREMPGAPGYLPRRLINRNRLLGYYEGANGVKNGFTEEAGLTNVASARRGETELIAVVLGAEGKLWTSSMALLDFGFLRYETRLVARQGDMVRPFGVPGVGMVEARVAEDLAVTVERGATPEQEGVQVEWLPELQPPIAVGDPVGWARYLLNGEEVGRVRLVAARAIDQPGPVAPGKLEVRAARPGEAALWLVLWLGGSLVLTLHLNQLRTPDGDRGAKEESERGAA